MAWFWAWLKSLFSSPALPPNGTVVTIPQTPPEKPPSGHPAASQAPWMDFMLARLGWTEFDHDKELSKYWHYSGMSYTSVIGAEHAWCIMIGNAAYEVSGFKGSGRPDAASGAHIGTDSDYVYGAGLAIRHANGKHHWTYFHHWVDQANRIAACLGGNQGNAINISNFNLSGNAHGHDEVMGFPRWPVHA